MTTQRALLVGNSDGIGLAFTESLIGAGWDVTGLSRSALSEAAIAGEHGDYRHFVGDVLAPDYVQTLEEIWSARGPFDLVVHLVGVGYGLNRDNFKHEAKTIRTNFVSMVELASIAMPKFAASGRGHFMGLSSIADEILLHDAPSYCASKAGYSAYLKSLALGYKRRGVAVTNVRFGFVDTKMAKGEKKPFMITTQKAAAVLMKCVARRPMQMTFPKTAGVGTRVLRAVQDVRIWFG
jgi:NAD(P)-dependent dehydrogenase (short-subunit alcohol dehydrogenase family)